LKNDLHALNPRYFKTLQDYFYKFKTLLSHVRDCGIDKKDEQLILFNSNQARTRIVCLRFLFSYYQVRYGVYMEYDILG
jgi:hypothetical protein